MDTKEEPTENAFTRAHHGIAMQAIQAFNTHNTFCCDATTLVSFIHPDGLDKFSEEGAIFITTRLPCGLFQFCNRNAARQRYGLRILLPNQKISFVRAPMVCTRDAFPPCIEVIHGEMMITRSDPSGGAVTVALLTGSQIYIKDDSFTLSSVTGAIFRGHCVHACVDFNSNASSSNQSMFLCSNQLDDQMNESPKSLTTRSKTTTHIPYDELMAKQGWSSETIYNLDDEIPWFAKATAALEEADPETTAKEAVGCCAM